MLIVIKNKKKKKKNGAIALSCTGKGIAKQRSYIFI
jgi:hypothetical protein